MKGIHIIAILLGVVLLILGACASPAPTTPKAAPAPAPTMPAPTTPKAAPTHTPTKPAPTAPTAAPAPVRGAFAVSQLKTDPESITLGENVTVSVMVANTGGQRGTYTVAVKFNGETIATEDVTLDGGASKKVKLTVMPETIGEFNITVDEQVIPRFEVLACPV